MTDPLSPKCVEFAPVSPKLATVKMVGALIVDVLIVIGVIAFSIGVSKWGWVALLPVAAGIAVDLWLIPRRVRAMGFAETQDELLIRRGVMFRKLTIIPYGRIQYVDLSEGPVARHFKFATIKVNTAASLTFAALPGIPSDEASRLRDHLAERGSAEMVGL